MFLHYIKLDTSQREMWCILACDVIQGDSHRVKVLLAVLGRWKNKQISVVHWHTMSQTYDKAQTVDIAMTQKTGVVLLFDQDIICMVRT
jgi:hypothetical protein